MSWRQETPRSSVPRRAAGPSAGDTNDENAQQPAARRFDAGRVIVNLRRRGATPTTAVCGLGKTARRRRRGVRWPAGGADGTDQSAPHTHSNRPLVGSAQGEQPERPDGRVHHPRWWSTKAGRPPAELGDTQHCVADRYKWKLDPHERSLWGPHWWCEKCAMQIGKDDPRYVSHRVPDRRIGGEYAPIHKGCRHTSMGDWQEDHKWRSSRSSHSWNSLY